MVRLDSLAIIYISSVLIVGVGDIAHFKIFSHHVIAINSHEAAVELLERRSAIYSDRPDLVLQSEMCATSSARVFDFDACLQYGLGICHVAHSLVSILNYFYRTSLNVFQWISVAQAAASHPFYIPRTSNP
jgi:hypothetical protein